MKRRAFICGGMAAILASRRAPAFCIALRNGMMRPSAPPLPWTNPYVTDGLVAMWDGEWNVSGGQHDGSSAIWKDIIGGIELDVGSNSFGDKWFNATNAIGATSGTQRIDLAQGTVEFVCEANPSGTSLFLLLGGTSTSDYKLGLYYSGGSHFICGNVIRSGAYVNLSNTRSIAVTYDGNSMGVFFNSESVETVSGVGSRATGTVMIGGGGGRTVSLNGKVFCVRVYSIVLTAAQIEANYAIDIARFNLP